MDCDMLVRLWEIQDEEVINLEKQLRTQNIFIKRALCCDLTKVCDFVSTYWPEWKDETTKGVLTNGCYIAVKGQDILGFCCFDTTMPDFIGPLGVRKDMRMLGIGKTLILKSIVSMKEKGYAYAILGWTGPQEFYKKICGATCIEGSIPGSYHNMLRVDEAKM